MESLSLVLWRERELLEQLLYKLEVEKFVLTSGNNRWLAMAAQEVGSVLERIRELELLRAVTADEAATAAGLSATPSIGALADVGGEPWHTILGDHRDALVLYTREITELVAANRELLTIGQRASREALSRLIERPEGYRPDGDPIVEHHESDLLDRSA
jgi:hypothetical protein